VRTLPEMCGLAGCEHSSGLATGDARVSDDTGEGAGIRTLNLGLKRPRIAIHNRSGPFVSFLVGTILGHDLDAPERAGMAALGE
jgi:hypothetical protein